jgi:hypothetical protein
MKKALVLSSSITVLIGLIAAGASADRGAPRTPQRILIVGRMYGVDGPFVGDKNPLNGINGDELPWEIKSARGRLDSDGHLKISVKGLVFADDPSVPPELVGKNDEKAFRGVLTCKTENEMGEIVDATVFTEGFPATESGDSDIDAMIHLPNPCVAPTLFVAAGSEDKWFAVAGFEEERD